MSITSRGLVDGGQHVGDADVDEARFLVPADDVDREAERRLRLRQECGRHCAPRERCWSRPRAPPTGAVPTGARETARGTRARPCARERGDASVLVESGAEADGLAPGVEAEDLVAFDAADLEAKAVRAQVDDGECRGSCAGCIGFGTAVWACERGGNRGYASSLAEAPPHRSAGTRRRSRSARRAFLLTSAAPWPSIICRRS